MVPAPRPLGSVHELKHFVEMSCWDCVVAARPLQFIHDKDGEKCSFASPPEQRRLQGGERLFGTQEVNTGTPDVTFDLLCSL